MYDLNKTFVKIPMYLLVLLGHRFKIYWFNKLLGCLTCDYSTGVGDT